MTTLSARTQPRPTVTSVPSHRRARASAQISASPAPLASPLSPLSPLARPDVSQALALFLTREIPARDFTDSTRRTYRYDLNAFLRFLPDGIPVPDLSLSLVKKYLALLDSRGLSSATRRRKLAAIKTFIAFLEKDDDTNGNTNESPLLARPFSLLIHLPKVERREPRYLSKGEYQALVREAADHPRDAALLEIFLQTGIRLSELVGLTLDDVELPAKPKRVGEWIGQIRIERKRRKVQYLTLNSRACQKLHAYLRVRPDADTRQVFLTKYRTPLTDRSVQKAFKKYACAAGLSWAHPHTLRTTFITHHIANHTAITDIRDMVGHENLATTNVYAGLVKSSQRKAMQEHAL